MKHRGEPATRGASVPCIVSSSRRQSRSARWPSSRASRSRRRRRARRLLALRLAFAAVVILVVSRARGRRSRGSTLGVLRGARRRRYGDSRSSSTALSLAPGRPRRASAHLHPALVAVLATVFLHDALTAAKLVALAMALSRNDAHRSAGDRRQRAGNRANVLAGLGSPWRQRRSRGVYRRGGVDRPSRRRAADEHDRDRQRGDGNRRRRSPRAAVAGDRRRLAGGGRDRAALDRAGDHVLLRRPRADRPGARFHAVDRRPFARCPGGMGARRVDRAGAARPAPHTRRRRARRASEGRFAGTCGRRRDVRPRERAGTSRVRTARSSRCRQWRAARWRPR